MNCQDIARILDEQEVGSLLARKQSDVQAHLATCRDCARDWQIHAQLADARIPAVPAELRALYSPQAGGVVSLGARPRSRFVIVGTLVAVAAAAAMLALQMNTQPAPVAATVDPVRVDPVQVEPSVIQGFGKVLPSPAEPMSEDESKAVDEWTQRVVEWLQMRDDPDALIAAAMLLRNDSGPVDVRRFQSLFQRAAAMAAESARIQAMAMFLCREEKPCDATPYEQALRRLAPDNAVGWVEEMNRAWRIKDQDAIQSALAAMARARTFDLYHNESMARMMLQIRAARVAPPETGIHNLPGYTDWLAFDALGEEMPGPYYPPLMDFCKSVTDESALLVCRQIGAAMRAGDSWGANVDGLTLSSSGLPADSAEMRALTPQRNLIKWLEQNMPDDEESAFPPDYLDRYLRALMNHPRETDAAAALLEEQGIPGKPPADWKP